MKQTEKAIRLLCGHMPSTETESRSTLFHCLRVGVYLYEHGYPRDIQIAGFLHDILEDTDVVYGQLKKEFGEKVADIVQANSVDHALADQDERVESMIKNCVAYGQEALIVKTADVMDNYRFDIRTDNRKRLEYCLKNLRYIKKHMPDGFDDQIFQDLPGNQEDLQ